MYMKRVLTLVMALLPLLAQGQYLQNYTAASSAGEWQSIAQSGTLLASVTGDYGTQTLALPFDFMFGQSDYPQGTAVTVRADGFVVMRGSGSSHSALNYWNQPSYSIISPFPLKDGQLVGTGSGCWWQLTADDSGEPMLVIEWRGLHRYPSWPVTQAETDLDNFNYQLRLHANGDISAVYGHMQSGVPSDSLFNFILTDGATMMGAYMDQNSLRGTWDSVVACSACSPGYRQGNNWVLWAANNLAGCPDSGTVVTWYRPQPPCPRPTAIAVTAVAHDTALLSWTPNEVAGSVVRIQWDTVNFTPGTAGHHLQLYGGDTMHLGGLAPNHQHWLYMRSDCGEDSSDWHGVQFTTPCAPLSHDELPLTEDLESYAEGYTTLWGGCSGNTVYVKDMQVYEGRPNMALRGNNNGWFRLPPVDSVRTTVLRFSGHGPFGGSSNVTVQVGVMDDPFDIGSLQVQQTFTVNQNSWQEYTVPLATYSGPGNTVAVKWSAYNMFFLDNISLEVYEGCLPVESVTASQVGQHSALVEWNAYVAAGDGYRVVWYPAGQEWLADSLTTAADSVLLTGLAAGTDYVVGVRALCSPSSASGLVTAAFRTRCALPLPHTEDFEALDTLPDCWAATSTTTTSSTGSYTPAVPAVVADGVNHAVKFSSQYTNYYNYERGILLLPFVDTVVNRLRLTFDYRVERFPHLMSLMVGVIPGDDVADFIPVATLTCNDTLWHTYTVETGAVPIVEGRLVLMQHSTGSHEYVQGYWRDLGYVDNVRIEVLPDCDRPAAVWVSQIGSTSVRVHWQENNGVGTYRVSCGDQLVTVANDTVLTLTGLDPASGYTVGVSRQCDGAWTDYRSVSFVTACAPVGQLPWYEDFESWTVGEIDHCWLRYHDTHEGSQVQAVSNSFESPDMGTMMLQMQAANYAFDERPYDAVAVLPEVGVSLAGMAIGFRVTAVANAASSLVLELGLLDDGGDSAGFRPIDTVALASVWSYYEYPFGPADSGRLAFRLKAIGSSGRLLIDDLGLFAATSCLRPSALSADTVTQHTATLVVTDTAATGSYRLYWRPFDMAGALADSVDFVGDSVTIGGLDPGVHYVASVAAVCDGGALSNIVYTEFYTDCDTILHADLPYQETFDGGTLNRCWTVLPAGAYVGFDAQHRRGTAGYGAVLSHTNYSPQSYLVLPVVDTLAGLDLTFWVSASTAYSQPGITVGILPDPADVSGFVPVQSIPVGTGWTEHQVSLGAYSTVGHCIALRPDMGDTAGLFVTIYVDNVSLSPSLPCQRPDSVAVDSVGATAAVLSVCDYGMLGRYRVRLTSEDGSMAFFLDLDSTQVCNQVTLTGLQPATDYSVSVSSVCYDGSVTFGQPAAFTTLCAPQPLSYREDFEGATVGQTPRCWVEGPDHPRVAAGTDSRYLVVTGADTSAWLQMASAEIAFDADSVQVTFDAVARQSYMADYVSHHLDSRLQVFAQLGDSLRLLYDDTVAYSNGWQQVTFAAEPQPYGARLLFRLWRDTAVGQYYSLWLDNLRVTSFAPEPVCDSVVDLTVSDIGYTQATLGWTPRSGESRWEVKLRGGSVNIATLADTPAVSFSTLDPGARYYALVRPLCSAVLAGAWSDTLWFSTDGCETVQQVGTAAVGATTATIVWQTAEGQERWLLNYGPQGFLQGEGIEREVAAPLGDGVQLTGLSPRTTYDLYVRALCTEDIQSDWSPVFTFTTDTLTDILAVDVGRAPVVYPNPCSSSATIQADAEVVGAWLTDMQGRRTEVSLVAKGQGCYALDMTARQPGLYLLVLTAADGRQHAVRLLKQAE